MLILDTPIKNLKKQGQKNWQKMPLGVWNRDKRLMEKSVWACKLFWHLFGIYTLYFNTY